MAIFSDPTLDKYYGQGNELLGAQQYSNQEALRRMYGSYGAPADPSAMGAFQQMSDAARRNNTIHMNGQFEEQNARHQLWQQKMDEFYREMDRQAKLRKMQEKQNRMGMWGAALGGLGQIGGGVNWGSMFGGGGGGAAPLFGDMG